jgi:regulator of sigma E protease
MSTTKPQRPTPPGDAAERQGPSPWGLLLLVALVALVATGHWALVVAVLGLALLIFIHELGHFLAAKAFHMRVERFYIGFPPAVIKRTRGETEYGIGVIPLGGFCKISGMTPDEKLPDDVVPRAYTSKPVWQRNITIAAGPFMNFVAAVVIMFVFIQAGGLQQPTLTVAQVVKGTPAAAAGLRAGDRLVAADGRTFTSWNATTTFFESHPHQAVTLTYRTPAGQLRTSTVTLTTRPGEPSKGFLGVGPKATPIYPAPWRAVGQAFSQTGHIVAATFGGMWMLVSGKINPAGPDGAAGPVGIISVSQTAVHQSWYPLLLAFISINLGIINLLPFLPFDGGHIFFNVLESVRGRKVDPRVLERAIAIGVVVLVTLFILLTFNDLQRLFHFG